MHNVLTGQLETRMRSQEAAERSGPPADRQLRLLGRETERQISHPSSLDEARFQPETDPLRALRQQLQGPREPARQEYWLQQRQPHHHQQHQHQQHFGHQQWDGSLARDQWRPSQPAGPARPGTTLPLPQRPTGPREEAYAQLYAASPRGVTGPHATAGQRGPAFRALADDAPPPSPRDAHHYGRQQQQQLQQPRWYDAAAATASATANVPMQQGPAREPDLERSPAPRHQATTGGMGGSPHPGRGFAASLGRSASAGADAGVSYDSLSRLDRLGLGLGAGGGRGGAAGGVAPEPKRPRLEAPAPMQPPLPAQIAGGAEAQLMRLLRQEHERQEQQQRLEQIERQEEAERQRRRQRLQQLERLERDERQQQEELLAACISRLEPELGALLCSRLLRGEDTADGSPRQAQADHRLPVEWLRGQAAGLVLLRSRSDGDDGAAAPLLMRSLPPHAPPPFRSPVPEPEFQSHVHVAAQASQPVRPRHSTGGLEQYSEHQLDRHQHQQDGRRLQQPVLEEPQQLVEGPLRWPHLLEQLQLLHQHLLQTSPPLPPQQHAAHWRSLGLAGVPDRRDNVKGRGSHDDDSGRLQPPVMHRSASAAAEATWAPQDPDAADDLLPSRGRAGNAAGSGSVGAGGGGRSAALGLQLAAASAFALRNMPQASSRLNTAEDGSGVGGGGSVMAAGKRGAAAADASAEVGKSGGASAAPAVEFLELAAAGTTTAAAATTAIGAGVGLGVGDEDERGLPRTRRCAVCRVKRKGRCGTTSAPPTCLGRELIDPAEEEAAEAAAAASKRGAAGGGRKGGRRRRISADSGDDADYSYKGSVKVQSMSASPDNDLLAAHPAAALLGVAAAAGTSTGRGERLLSDPTGWATSVAGGGSRGKARGAGGPDSAVAGASYASDGLALLARLASLADEAPDSPFAAGAKGSPVQKPQPKLEASRLQPLRPLIGPAATAGAQLPYPGLVQGSSLGDGFAAAGLVGREPLGGGVANTTAGAATPPPSQLPILDQPLPPLALQGIPELARMLAAAPSAAPGSGKEQQPVLSRLPAIAAATRDGDADGVISGSGSGAAGSCLPRVASGQPSVTAGGSAALGAAADAAAAAVAAETAAAGADAEAEPAEREPDIRRHVMRCGAPAHVGELQALLDSHAAAAALPEAPFTRDRSVSGQQQESAAAGVFTVEVDLGGKATTPGPDTAAAAAAADPDAPGVSKIGAGAEGAAAPIRVRRGQRLVLRNGSLRACVVVESGATAQLEQVQLTAAPASGAAAAAAAAVVLVQGADSHAVLRHCKVSVAADASAAAAAAAAPTQVAPAAAPAAAAAAEGSGADENTCCVLVRAGGGAVLQCCELSGAPNAGLSVEGLGSSARATSTTARGCGLGFLASAGGVLEAVSGCAAVSNGMGFLALSAPAPAADSTEAAAGAAPAPAPTAAPGAEGSNVSSPGADCDAAGASTSTSSDSGGSDRPAAAAGAVGAPPAAQLLAGPRTAAAHNGAAGFGAIGCGSVLSAGAGCRSLGNQGCGFLAAQGGRLTVGDESLAEGNDSGFAASGAGSVLVTGARCEAVGAAGCGFLAEEGAELAAARGCVALGGAAHGFCARTGGRLVLSDGCQSECNAGRGFCDGSQAGEIDGAEGGGNSGGGRGEAAEAGGVKGGGRGHLQLGVGCVSMGNLEPCAAAAIAAGLLRAPGAADGNAADVRAARAVLAAAGVLAMPAQAAAATAGLFHSPEPL